MKILFDQGTPVPFRNYLLGATVSTAYEQGWSQLSNGTLIATAEANGFDALVTTDRNLRYQQNLSARKLSIFVLPTTSWPKLRMTAQDLANRILSADSGIYIEL